MAIKALTTPADSRRQSSASQTPVMAHVHVLAGQWDGSAFPKRTSQWHWRFIWTDRSARSPATSSEGPIASRKIRGSQVITHFATQMTEQ